MKHLWSRSVFTLAILLGVSLTSLFYTASRVQRQIPVQSADASFSESASSRPEPAEDTVTLPIAMYHHILKEQSRLNKYTISPDEFRQDMEYLKKNGYTPITMTELIAWSKGEGILPEKPAMITFDDGYESFHEYAYPILQEYGFKAVISVVGKYTDLYSETDDHHVRYSHCTWEQLKEMQDSGLVEVQNHTYNLHVNANGRHGSHKKPGESDEAYRKVLLEDVGKLQEKCYEYLGRYPNTFTYPFGQISKEALPTIKEMGFQAALICQEKFNHLTGDPEELFRLNRINRPHGSPLQSLWEKAQAEEQKKK